jgi:hypothetical protein
MKHNFITAQRVLCGQTLLAYRMLKMNQVLYINKIILLGIGNLLTLHLYIALIKAILYKKLYYIKCYVLSLLNKI